MRSGEQTVAARSEPTEPRFWSGGQLGRVAIALGITLIVFFPALDNQFVNWDDDA